MHEQESHSLICRGVSVGEADDPGATWGGAGGLGEVFTSLNEEGEQTPGSSGL